MSAAAQNSRNAFSQSVVVTVMYRLRQVSKRLAIHLWQSAAEGSVRLTTESQSAKYLAVISEMSRLSSSLSSGAAKLSLVGAGRMGMVTEAGRVQLGQTRLKNISNCFCSPALYRRCNPNNNGRHRPLSFSSIAFNQIGRAHV